MLSREEAQRLVRRALDSSHFPEMSVSLEWRQNCNTRFANNQITTAGFTTDLSMSTSVTREQRTGQSSTTETTQEALERAVRRAEELATLTPANPEYVEPLGPQNYPEIKAFDQAAADARSAALLPAVHTTIASAEAERLTASGFFTVQATAVAIANKNGLFGYHQRTWADYSATLRTADGSGSGWAESEGPRLAQVDTERVSSTAVRKALASEKPRRLDPGQYIVILEPAALNEVLMFVVWNMGAREAEEGRTFLSKRGGGTLLGEKVFGENVTLRSDPLDARVPGWPWNDDLPTRKIIWVEAGVVRNFSRDRYWAKKTQQPPVPPPTNLLMEGGGAKVEELIASTERGLLVTHFWYTRYLQPDTVQVTGLTRDGLFYIEKGKIQYPVMNFRFNQSVVEMLKQVEAMTPPVPVGNNLLPAIKVRNFTMASLSDAV